MDAKHAFPLLPEHYLSALTAETMTTPVKYAVVDAFTDSAFKGNPAAVCLLEEDREERWLQSVATEFSISETAYLTRIHDPNPNSSTIPRFKLRWFTPVTEVNLCGHATLASSHFCFTFGLVKGPTVEFSILSGILTATKVQESSTQFSIKLNFPVVLLVDDNPIDTPSISEALNGARIVDVKRTTTDDDLFVVLESFTAVTDLRPQMEKIHQPPGRGIIVSSLNPPEYEFDLVSRFFCPKNGVGEDPVCGSAHCALSFYWSEKLGKREFLAYVASARSGVVKVKLDEKSKRVGLRGRAVVVMEGSILV